MSTRLETTLGHLGVFAAGRDAEGTHLIGVQCEETSPGARAIASVALNPDQALALAVELLKRSAANAETYVTLLRELLAEATRT